MINRTGSDPDEIVYIGFDNLIFSIIDDTREFILIFFKKLFKRFFLIILNIKLQRLAQPQQTLQL